jgi:hypothetical protein
MWAVTWIGDSNLEYWNIIYVYVFAAVRIGSIFALLTFASMMHSLAIHFC